MDGVLHTPNSNNPLPQTPQNSRCSNTPDPLSASCTLTCFSPSVILNEERGILVVMPKGPPVNFYMGRETRRGELVIQMIDALNSDGGASQWIELADSFEEMT